MLQKAIHRVCEEFAEYVIAAETAAKFYQAQLKEATPDLLMLWAKRVLTAQKIEEVFAA